MELGFRRIQKEITEIERNSGLTGNSIKVYGDNDASHLCGSIRGPQGTPYEEGVFQVDIRVPQQYPFVPPKMQFITKVWHPNISSASGAICLDILKDKWSPALTLNTALLSLQALLSAPEPNDPQDAVVARQYLTDYEAFLNTARNYTNAFANELGVDDEDKIQRLVDKGFPVELVRTILQKCCGDENWALEKLLLLSS